MKNATGGPRTVQINQAVNFELERLQRRIAARNGIAPQWVALLGYAIASAHRRLDAEGVPDAAPVGGPPTPPRSA